MSIAPKPDSGSLVSAQKDVSGEQRVEELMPAVHEVQSIGLVYAKPEREPDGTAWFRADSLSWCRADDVRAALVSALGVSPPRPSEEEVAREMAMIYTLGCGMPHCLEPHIATAREAVKRYREAESAVLSRQKKEEG